MVLAAARTLIAEVGLAGFTYTTVAERSGVTRQTLYRHWPDREELLREIQLEGPDNYQQRTGRDDLRSSVLEALHAYVDWMACRDNAKRLLALMSSADGSADAGLELAALVERAREDLDRRLQPAGLLVDSASFALLLGPVTSRRFLDRGPITEEFLEEIADRYIGIFPAAEARVREPGRPAAKV